MELLLKVTEKVMRALTNSGTGSWRTSEVLLAVNSKKPSTMKRTLTSLAVGAACFSASLAQAQITVGLQETFDAVPPVTSWSTRSIPGGGGAPVTIEDLDILVQTNTAALINTVLGTSGTVPPSANAIARQNSTAKYAQTLPTGNAATVLMATIVNSTAANLPNPKITYDFLVPSAVNSEDTGTAGHIVYYSLTGAENSWVKIPELCSAQPTPVAGQAFVELALGTWAPNSNLYIIWVDDNGNGATDGSFAIDNFVITGDVIPPPVITTQPVGATNLVGRTVRTSVVATGVGIQYQWNSPAGPIDAGANPSAATASLVITNAQLSDTGDYFCSITSPYGNVTSASAHIQINPDTFAPRFLSAKLGANNTQIILVVDERLCEDGLACGSNFKDLPSFNFDIFNPNNVSENLGVFEVASQNDTNIIITVSNPWVPGNVYRINMINQNGGIGDLSGNIVPENTFIDTLPTLSFQQGVNGYTGTQDAGIHSGTADTADGANAIINVDGDDGGIRQALLRFDNIFGSNPGQVPSGVTIKEASLTLNQTDNGNVVNLHRMLVSWDQNTVTWNLLTDGVNIDGTDAAAAIDSVTPGLNGVVGPITIDVTTSLAAWAAGQPNHGWALMPTGGDGWRWNSSESGVAPILTITYEITPCDGVPTITTQPPTATSVNEHGAISIAVGVGNTCPDTTFQWLKGNLPGTVVAGQTGSTLSIASAAPGDAGIYRLRATNPAGSVTSDPVNVTVVADTTRPTLTRAIGTNETHLTLTFSEALGAGADQASHYTVSGATVSGVSVLNNVVTLTTSARPAGTSTVTITGLTDAAATPNLLNPNPTTVSLTTAGVVAGADAGSVWSYNTNNLDASADWATTGGAGWLDGNGIFGTETSAGLVFPAPIATVIPPPNANNEFLTSYYRKTVTLPALAAGMSYALSYIVDDGAVFFLDGNEIGRYNMPAGAVTYSTLAPAAGAEGAIFALPLGNISGTHTIAVSVHQSSNTSSDIVFGAEVIAIPTASPSLSVTHSGANAIITWNADASWELIGSGNVAGPYAAVAGNPFRTLTTPMTTTNQFYQLRYRPQP